MSYLTPEQARAEQLREGQRMARCDDDSVPASRPRLTARPGYESSQARPSTSTGHLRSSTRAAKPKSSLTGHEAFIKALYESGARIKVYLLDQEEQLVGKIRAHDKFTVSIDEETETPGQTEVNLIFKHAIQRIKPLRRESAPKPAAEKAEEGHYQ